MKSTTIFLIRHGQTDWNLAGRLQGHADIPLNAKGIEQAQQVAQFLKKKHVLLDALYSSDLLRAQQTAQEIAKLFALDIILVPDLREGNFGKLQGLTKQEALDLFGPYDHENLPAAAQAEPRDQVVARVLNFLKYIAQNHMGQQVAVITHGAALGSLLKSLGYDLDEWPALTNESIVTLKWQAHENRFVLELIEHA